MTTNVIEENRQALGNFLKAPATGPELPLQQLLRDCPELCKE